MSAIPNHMSRAAIGSMIEARPVAISLGTDAATCMDRAILALNSLPNVPRVPYRRLRDAMDDLKRVIDNEHTFTRDTAAEILLGLSKDQRQLLFASLNQHEKAQRAGDRRTIAHAKQLVKELLIPTGQTGLESDLHQHAPDCSDK